MEHDPYRKAAAVLEHFSSFDAHRGRVTVYELVFMAAESIRQDRISWLSKEIRPRLRRAPSQVSHRSPG